MMEHFLLVAAVLLALSLLVGLLTILWRASVTDRLLAAQLIGTVGIGVLLVLSVLLAQPALVDAALILAMLAVLVTAVFTHKQRLQQARKGSAHD
ncbi:MAG: MrpF/PhaF family protein [Thiolinea sp.]